MINSSSIRTQLNSYKLDVGKKYGDFGAYTKKKRTRILKIYDGFKQNCLIIQNKTAQIQIDSFETTAAGTSFSYWWLSSIRENVANTNEKNEACTLMQCVCM